MLIVEVAGPAAYAGDDTYVEWAGAETDGLLSAWAWDGADARLLDLDGRIVAEWTGLPCPRFAELEAHRKQDPSAGADV